MRFLGVLVVLWASSALAETPAAVQVRGMVAQPGPVQLEALKQVSLAAGFLAKGGREAHRWSGPLLLDVLAAAVVTDEPGKKTHLRHTILASGADGYAVAIAIGEIDPLGEGKQIIVALREDDKALPAPRLVVPGDAHFARGVHDLVALEVR
jgi:hypothetical protein